MKSQHTFCNLFFLSQNKKTTGKTVLKKKEQSFWSKNFFVGQCFQKKNSYVDCVFLERKKTTPFFGSKSLVKNKRIFILLEFAQKRTEHFNFPFSSADKKFETKVMRLKKKKHGKSFLFDKYLQVTSLLFKMFSQKVKVPQALSNSRIYLAFCYFSNLKRTAFLNA